MSNASSGVLPDIPTDLHAFLCWTPLEFVRDRGTYAGRALWKAVYLTLDGRARQQFYFVAYSLSPEEVQEAHVLGGVKQAVVDEARRVMQGDVRPGLFYELTSDGEDFDHRWTPVRNIQWLPVSERVNA